MATAFNWIYLAALSLAVVISDVRSQTLMLGPCPAPPIQANFSAQDFMGRWYEIERSRVLAEAGWNCVHTDYIETDGRIRVETVGKVLIRRAMYALATFTPNNPARIVLRVEGSLPTQSTNYVLLTDYNNFALVWSCRNVDPPLPITGLEFLRNFSHTENLWLLSRQRSLSHEYRKRVTDYLDKNAFIRSSLRPVNQANCDEPASSTTSRPGLF